MRAMKDKDAVYMWKRAKRKPTNERDWVVATAVGGNSVAPSRVCHGGSSPEAQEFPELHQGTKTKLTPGGKTGGSPPS